MRKSKLIRILVFIGLVFFIVFVVVPPFTRRWYQSHSIRYAPPPPPEKWKKFSSEEGRFSIWFPGTPIETNLHVTNSAIVGETHLFHVNLDIQDAFIVGYCDNKLFEAAMKNGKAQEFLKKSESFVLAKDNGTILSENATTLGKFPAREFEYKAGRKANYSVRVKYVMSGQRIYSLTAVFMAGNPYPEARATFFDSFHLENGTR